MEQQGKRPDQVKLSEDITFWAIIGLVGLLLITLIF